MSIDFRPQARLELLDLLTDIRTANPRAADDLQDAVQRTLERLEALPLSGARMRVRNPHLRQLRATTVSSYPQVRGTLSPDRDRN
ncbi:hypothetical protein GobsT_17520 [Gemmata obscuriglobus]|uniref:Type II toxin-antitoxin system RelE/ParE family toxin n=1 Tax=Gemmata obscuriglobus TaxID=114 RepID=A0A2Z3HDU4_9BACT|nr:hypothetical protein [Gemmata obscuriglobus]AWM39874.1 hypothetical protein C1280_24590 [Gemmata obscuriglobus]QEG27000.1 hypothetical protein GobsT_17520 [Gemmata obscuriglobus]VTS03290.1 : Plasmid_stabil [Gemmata obscuriglobus UQM 2246]